MKNKLRKTGYFFAVSLTALLLEGCGEQHKDGRPPNMDKKCINGVTYYITAYKMAPAYNINGTLIDCQ